MSLQLLFLMFLYISACPFVHALFAIVLSVHRHTTSDYPFDIFKLFALNFLVSFQTLSLCSGYYYVFIIISDQNKGNI